MNELPSSPNAPRESAGTVKFFTVKYEFNTLYYISNMKANAAQRL